jgi:gamma-glutamyltranspeptidase / glutathione hydrolase
MSDSSDLAKSRRQTLKAAALLAAASPLGLIGTAHAQSTAASSLAVGKTKATKPAQSAQKTPANISQPGKKGQGDRYSGAPWASRSNVIAQSGMVATSIPLASQIGLDILKAGGSAVDAAIAANAALGLMEPTGCGIGGDLFAIIWDPKTKKLHGLNAAGRAPLGQSLSQLKDKLKSFRYGRADDMGIPDWGALSVTIPGAVDGWYALHSRFGKLPMAQILAPAIGYAQNGFPVSELIAHYLKGNMASLAKLHASGALEEFANARAVFMRQGATPAEGEIFKNPDLANTYQILAQEGRDAFYLGRLADAMERYFIRINAPHRKADLAAHRHDWVEPVSVNYRGVDVFELPPPGQGIACLQMLNLLEAYDLKRMGWGSKEHLHLMVEAKKLAFEDRARFYADPEFYQKPVLKTLLSKDYAAQRRALIRMDQVLRQVEHGDPKLVEGDTIYLTTADSDGMMVSFIQSNYRGLGSGLVPDGEVAGTTLGFMLQDRGAQFALEASHPNVYAPGKRPFHTIIPAFALKDGQPWLSFGLMGGAMQPQGHAQIIVNMVDFGMTPQQAGDAARFHHDGASDATREALMRDGGTLELESGFDPEVVQALQALGHQVKITTGPFGGYQAILRDPKTNAYWGASEFRKDGQAVGY